MSMIDLPGELKRIQNKDVNETFAQATDSLEAIRDFLTAFSGEGLCYYGVVTAIPGANQFTIPTLAGLGAGKFDGVNNPYFAFVLRDAVGAAAAPQGEQQPITAYVTATGIFTTTAFTAAVGVGDEILIISPYLAAMAMLWAEHSGALAYLGQCPVGMAPSTNVISCPGLAYIPAQTFTRGYQMIVLRNANAPGNPPEMETRAITNFGAGLFATAAFSANIEENDVVLIIHNSLATQISAYGIADAGSGVGIVRDAARTEANDWWNGQTVMMLSGAALGQKRPIADFIAATDDIVPAPNFDAAVAAGDLYVILAHYNPIVPRTTDSVANYLTSDVVGRKDDTAVFVADNISSAMRYLKGLMSSNPALLFDLVNAIFTLKETGGTITTDGTEQDVYRNETPMGIFKPKRVMIDFTTQTAAETVVVRVYYRIISGGNLIKKDEVTFAGAQDPDLKNIELEPNRFGVRVTIQRTVIGVDRAYNWEAFYED